MRTVFCLWILLAGIGAAERVAAASQDSEAMLERFRPTLYFEDNGPGGVRREYPTSYVWDDSDIEDNFASPAVAPSVFCYGQVHEQRDAAGKICWVVEYHFYYPRNWTHFSFGFSFAGYTHEHDWEWLYVVVGSSGGLLRPYCACFSSHADNNQALFEDAGRVRLFPGITGGSVWSDGWAGDPDSAPRVSLSLSGQVEATILASGNEFDGTPEQGRFGIPCTSYPASSVELAQSSCLSADTFYYGDPGLPSGCLICDGFAECGGPRLPPWTRFGLGDQTPLPVDFKLPDDWDENASTEVLPSRTSWRVGPIPCDASLRFRFTGNGAPERLELWDTSGRRVRESVALAVDGSADMDVRGIPSGLYLARAIFADRAEEVQRVVVLR
jgi:hypothetical protein